MASSKKRYTPDGYVQKGKEHLVCKLDKIIYGFKQSSRCWYSTMDTILKASRYEQCDNDPCLYVKQVEDGLLMIALYVDDMLIASNNKKLLRQEKEVLKETFCMNDLGEAHYCLGLQIERERDPNGRKSCFGYVFMLCGGTISWLSKKQATIALSFTEAEYVAVSIAAQEAIWLRGLLQDLNFHQEQPTIIQEDNQGAIAMSRNPKHHGRAKHVDIRYHFIRDKVKNNEIMLKYCQTKELVADTLTKALPKNQSERFSLMLEKSCKV